MHGKSTSKLKKPVLIISSKLEWAHSSFRHVFVKLDQSANTRAQWPAYHKKCSIQGKIKEAICNHQADSPLYVWPDVWSGDLQV